MKNKILSVIKTATMLYCTMFTIGTLANTVLWLYFGLETNEDVHGHIMIRAGLVLYITIILTLVAIVMKNILAKSRTVKELLLRYGLACTIILLLIFIYIWASTSGYLWVSAEEIHPNAFRDLTRSVLLPATVVAVAGFFIMLRKKRRK